MPEDMDPTRFLFGLGVLGLVVKLLLTIAEPILPQRRSRKP